MPWVFNSIRKDSVRFLLKKGLANLAICKSNLLTLTNNPSSRVVKRLEGQVVEKYYFTVTLSARIIGIVTSAPMTVS